MMVKLKTVRIETVLTLSTRYIFYRCRHSDGWPFISHIAWTDHHWHWRRSVTRIAVVVQCSHNIVSTDGVSFRTLKLRIDWIFGHYRLMLNVYESSLSCQNSKGCLESGSLTVGYGVIPE